MMRFFLRSKIHRATVTQANLDYEGSVTIDGHLMNAAGLLPFEEVEIYNISNGNRFKTYVIEGEGGQGQICINGAAAHLAGPGDKIIIACYCALHDGQVLDHKPKIVFVDANNGLRSLQEAETMNTSAGSGVT